MTVGVKSVVLHGALNTGASATTDFTLAGFGTPKAAIIEATYAANDDGTAEAELKHSVGFYSGNFERYATYQTEDGAAKEDADQEKGVAGSLKLLTVAGGDDGTTVPSFITDGLRLTNSTAFSAAVRVVVTLFGGADLQAHVDSIQVNSTQDATSAATPNIDSDIVFFAGMDRAQEGSSGSGITSSFGVATTGRAAGQSLVNRSISFSVDHNDNVGDPYAKVTNNRCLSIVDEAGALDWGIELTSSDATTITVTTRDASAGAGMEVYYLALALPSYHEIALDGGTDLELIAVGDTLVNDTASGSLLIEEVHVASAGSDPTMTVTVKGTLLSGSFSDNNNISVTGKATVNGDVVGTPSDRLMSEIGSIDSPTASGNWSKTGLPFTPQYVGLGINNIDAENTIKSDGQAGAIGVSHNTGGSEEACLSWYDEDGTASVNSNSLFRSQAILLKDDGVVSDTYDLSHSSFDVGGWTYSQVGTPSGTASKWIYAAIEEVQAGFNQSAFSGRNDDGNITTATYTGFTDNVPWAQLPDANFRVRFQVQENNRKALTTSFQLQYSLNGGTWTDVNGSSSVVRSSAGGAVDGDDCPEKFTGTTKTFITDNNGYDETDGVTGSCAFTADAEAEFEFCVQIRSADTKYGDRIELRMVRSDGIEFLSYENTPVVFRDTSGNATLRQVEKINKTLSTSQFADQDHTLTTTLLDVDKAFLRHSQSIDSVNPGSMMVAGEIFSTTAVRFDRSDIEAIALPIVGYVAEFTEGVRVERGVVTKSQMDSANPTAGQFTVTLQNIFDASKAWVNINVHATLSGGGSAYSDDETVTAILSESAGVVSLLFQCSNTTDFTGEIKWEVVQYKNCTVQRDTAGGMTAVTSITDAIPSAVDTAKSFLQLTHRVASGAAGDIGTLAIRGRITTNVSPGDQVTIDRDRTTVNVDDVHWEVIEFTDSTVVEEVLEAFISTDAQEDASISEVSDLAKALPVASTQMCYGKTAASSGDNLGVLSYSLELTSTTNLRSIRGNTDFAADVALYVVDFGGGAPPGGGRLLLIHPPTLDGGFGRGGVEL